MHDDDERAAAVPRAPRPEPRPRTRSQPGEAVVLGSRSLEELMGLALDEARAALDHDDVPVGAIVVSAAGDMLASRHNERELTSDPLAHAEVLALRDATGVVGDGWRLEGATLIVTLEPCVMCAGALLASRVARVVFGAADPAGGACGSLYNVCADPRLNHEVEVVHGVRGGEAAELLTGFFAVRRNEGPASR